jgi:hypothetical protein
LQVLPYKVEPSGQAEQLPNMIFYNPVCPWGNYAAP